MLFPPVKGGFGRTKTDNRRGSSASELPFFYMNRKKIAKFVINY